jgi:tRNA-binding EMAP/Myf-like protein
VNSTHRVDVVQITEIEKHPNADALGIVRVLG